MKIGICWGAFPCSFEERVRHLRENGVDMTFCDSWNPRLGEIAELCNNANIQLESLHAPFSHINDIWLDKKEGEQMLSELFEAVDNCQKYGIPTLVVHLSSGDNPPPICPLGMERFARLWAYAKERGVRIAYENQRKLANLALVFEEFPDAGFCWDTGHEACLSNWQGLQYMPIFGQKLSVLHIHDNHGVHNADEHMIPFDGTLDFDRIASQIAATDYHGAVMLEIFAAKTQAYMDMGADAFYRRAADAARRLRDDIAKKRGVL